MLDLGIRARFLAAELVAGKAEDGEALRLVFLENGLQALVLRGVAAFGATLTMRSTRPLNGASVVALPSMSLTAIS